ncbi:MAG: hypothetical protein QOC56_2887 [Alphaproteobacteria bacterium]|nr:hypothetical protein [Alphaproteobacteria bacterium]
MTKVTPSIFIATLLVLGLHSASAQAQLTRTFVSANGVDTNSCGRNAPCRTLIGAYAKTNVNGEINMLDPAGYGTLTITHSISIVNDGVGSAGILVPSLGTGITISAGAGDVINLRGLIIEGAGVGAFGIKFNSGKALTIENCVIRNLTADGIRFLPNASSSLAVSKTYIADNNTGVSIAPSGSGSVTASFLRVEVNNSANGDGITVSGASSTGVINVNVTNSVLSGNASANALQVYSQTAQATATATVIRSALSNNSAGAAADGAKATLRIGGSTLTGNGSGWFALNSATVLSYGDNQIDGNLFGNIAPPFLLKK